MRHRYLPWQVGRAAQLNWLLHILMYAMVANMVIIWTTRALLGLAPLPMTTSSGQGPFHASLL